jgi:hypothetical protein
MVWHCGDVGPDTAGRVSQAGPILDLHAHEGVRVVGAPDLRAVVQHPRVKPTT